MEELKLDETKSFGNCADETHKPVQVSPLSHWKLP